MTNKTATIIENIVLFDVSAYAQAIIRNHSNLLSYLTTKYTTGTFKVFLKILRGQLPGFHLFCVWFQVRESLQAIQVFTNSWVRKRHNKPKPASLYMGTLFDYIWQVFF